jgi:hypothetical protein
MLPPAFAPGKRHTLPMPPGSADALLLARVAQARASGAAPMVVVTAEPFDAQRLAAACGALSAQEQARDHGTNSSKAATKRRPRSS